MKAYGYDFYPPHIKPGMLYPDCADLVFLGKTNRKASDRRAARRVYKKMARSAARKIEVD